MIRNFLLSLAFAGSLAAQGWPPAPGAMSFQSARSINRDDSEYQNGMRELDERHWDRAIRDFEASVSRNRASSDAALYWKAYAESRAGRREEALATVAALRSQFPSSRWTKDANALELEMRGQAGAPPNPNAQSDEELKLLAINSLMQSDPDQAVPILQKLLKGDASEKLKERAMFVLTQSSSPEARNTLNQIAHDSANPALQRRAIRYMGLMGNPQTRADLVSIYKSSSDVQLKHDIIRSFMQSGSRDFLFDVAKTEQNPELRKDAIRQLGVMGAQDQLRQLYESETSVENKKTILNSMFVSGNSTWMEELARNEKDPALRLAAIKDLGIMGRRGNGEVLVSIYQSDQNPDIRHAVLNSLFLQQNGKALVDLARSEKDPKWKQEIVQKMSLVHSKEVTDYMMEVLK
ncbi:MAG TPA: HEAT repeat domain-containing protein [Bryobacteraceae bacterium]|nr:HEAT repeat domain-containing protein [Bryobacteraceae bacterium]